MPTARALLHLALLVPLALAHTQQPTDHIHINVERVNIGVIVTDSHGDFVEGLRREDFHIFDDGTERPITDFATLDEPAQIVLLIEAGPAVYLFEGGHLRAAHALLDGLSPSDRVAIVKYAEAPQAVLDFTADKPAASAALDNLHFNLGFGQLNLSSSLSAVLHRLTSLPRKKTVVLLSTGVDTSPENEWGAILERLKVSDVRVLAVSLSGDLQNPLPAGKKRKFPAEKSAATAKEFIEANHLLQIIAESTGGRAYFPKKAKEFSAAYAEIAQLVRHEYSLAFTPPNHDGKVHAIEVRISDAGGSATPVASAPVYRIDHRGAYFAPTQ
jgi:VWFA-related protein